MKKISIVLATVMLSGCAVAYTKPGVSQQQAERDIKRCKFEARQQDGVAWPDIVNLCLEAKGYDRGR